VSSTFLGLSSRPYLLASAVCRLPLLVLTPRQLPLLPPTTRQLHLEASSTSEVSSTMQPRTACLPSLLVSPTPPSTIFVSTTRSCRLPLLVDYSLYQHLLEIQCAVRNIFNERVMDRGYLGDVGRRTVMRFGTVDP